MKKLTVRQIRRAVTMGALESAANEEYWKRRYSAEKGGPALARLSAFRKDARLTKPPKEKP